MNLRDLRDTHTKSGLRFLDVDDFIIMKCLGDGYKGIEIASVMGLTHPAIIHRLNKYQSILGNFFEVKEKIGGATRVLTPRGSELCEAAGKVLTLLLDMKSIGREQSVFQKLGFT